MTTRLDPIAPEIAALLDEERAAVGLPSGARDRLRERLAALGPVPIPAGHRGGGDDTTAATSTPGSAFTASAKAAIASKIGVAAVAFGIGAATGAVATAKLEAPLAARAPVVTVDEPAFVKSPLAPAEAASAEAATPVDSLADAPTEAAPARTPEPLASRNDRLKRERTALEVARTAITRRDFGAGLTALDRHAREFPRGQLAEERETLRIQALVGQGRVAEAREQAAQFRRTFPGSMMQGAVDVAIGSTSEVGEKNP